MINIKRDLVIMLVFLSLSSTTASGWTNAQNGAVVRPSSTHTHQSQQIRRPQTQPKRAYRRLPTQDPRAILPKSQRKPVNVVTPRTKNTPARAGGGVGRNLVYFLVGYAGRGGTHWAIEEAVEKYCITRKQARDALLVGLAEKIDNEPSSLRRTGIIELAQAFGGISYEELVRVVDLPMSARRKMVVSNYGCQNNNYPQRKSTPIKAFGAKGQPIKPTQYGVAR